MSNYRLKSFSENGDIVYSIQKRFFGFIWLTLSFYPHSINADVYVELLVPGSPRWTTRFTKQSAYNVFNSAIWAKARKIVHARKRKNHKNTYRTTYSTFP